MGFWRLCNNKAVWIGLISQDSYIRRLCFSRNTTFFSLQVRDIFDFEGRESSRAV